MRITYAATNYDEVRSDVKESQDRSLEALQPRTPRTPAALSRNWTKPMPSMKDLPPAAKSTRGEGGKPQ
jgi:hypothetical protein